ncbi:MAG: hypothetical protein ACREDT_05610 [Methylocella sp.]
MNNSPDRLYDLLPAIYRLRDADQGYPLRDLLRVIAEQVNAVEADITQLYDNWFIETAQDWVVPYIADLIGYTPINAPGDPSTESLREERILVPRVEVANTVAYRQRRGTLSVLENLAAAVAGSPARAVEFFRVLLWTQNLDHRHSDGYRARVASLRSANVLDKIGTPFDPFAHTVDVRRINSHRSEGKYNIPSVGLWVWRLKSYSVTYCAAYCLDVGKSAYTFSILGNDAPLFTKPVPELTPTHIAQEINVPTPIRRWALDADIDAYYGVGKSLVIWADWAGHTVSEPVPASAIQPADLTDWHYSPPDGYIAVDPVLGRIQFPVKQLPKRHVRVSYRYGFSGDIGGGEYPRTVSQPEDAKIYQVGEGALYRRIAEALVQWRQEQPEHAVIEITDSRAYVEPINIALQPNQSLQLRAASECRPVIRLLDWQIDAPDALVVAMAEGSEITFDGLLVTGRSVSIAGVEDRTTTSVCAARVNIRHCTFVPGWSIECNCEPCTPNKESLKIRNVRARVSIERSILGPIEVQEDDINTDPIPIEICDGIIDAMDGEREAIIGPQGQHAHAAFTIRPSTVFGIMQVHAVELGENSIFLDCVHVARRQIGCMRFCYVPAGCRTPKRYNCQPDLVIAAASGNAAQAREAERVIPAFTTRRYGGPTYAQLSVDCAREIFEGADDGAEMGVFHNLFQPQRLANLRARLDEFCPAGMDAGVLLAN